MTISDDNDLARLKEIGRIVANTLEAMGKALEPGMSTSELDQIGRTLLEAAGARSAPELAYDFPGATCISVNEEIAHGIPGDRRIARGDLVNIDVSAEKNGFFADTGASFAVPPATRAVERLCRDGRRAMWTGLQQVGAGKPIAGIGQAIGPLRGRTVTAWSGTLPVTASACRSTRSRRRSQRGPTAPNAAS